MGVPNSKGDPGIGAPTRGPAETRRRCPDNDKRTRARAAVALLAGSMLVGNVDPTPTSAAAPGNVVNSQPDTATAPLRAVATGCNHLVFHTRRERQWVNRVHRLTDLTCRQARRVYRRGPSWRDELPTRVRRAAGDRRIPNPAVVGLDEPAGATSSTLYCWVWTRESYRAPTFPFGHHTLWSVTVGQTFAYDGHNVIAISAPTVRPDTTSNGFRWFADGAPWGFDVVAAVLGTPSSTPPSAGRRWERGRSRGSARRTAPPTCASPCAATAPGTPKTADPATAVTASDRRVDATAGVTWYWCTTHRQPHRSDEPGHRGCTLAGPFASNTEAETFGRRTDPEAFSN